MTLIKKRNFGIDADYRQFYLLDEKSPFKIHEIWSKEGFELNLWTSRDLIVVGTDRWAKVPVTIEIHESSPPFELIKYSQVNECSLEVHSGKIAICGCLEPLEEAARIETEPGIYRVRVLYGNLETVVSDSEGDDFYILQLWKDSKIREIQQIKKFSEDSR